MNRMCSGCDRGGPDMDPVPVYNRGIHGRNIAQGITTQNTMEYVTIESFRLSYSMSHMQYRLIHYHQRPGNGMRTGHPEHICLCGNDPQAIELLQSDPELAFRIDIDIPGSNQTIYNGVGQQSQSSQNSFFTAILNGFPF